MLGAARALKRGKHSEGADGENGLAISTPHAQARKGLRMIAPNVCIK